MGYVFIKFTSTRGGTDLGVRVDKSATDLSQAYFDQATGVAHVEGTLTLNYVQIRCVADIDLTLHPGGFETVLPMRTGTRRRPLVLVRHQWTEVRQILSQR